MFDIGRRGCSYSGSDAGLDAPRVVDSACLLRSRAAAVSNAMPRTADRLNGFSGGVVRGRGSGSSTASAKVGTAFPGVRPIEMCIVLVRTKQVSN